MAQIAKGSEKSVKGGMLVTRESSYSHKIHELVLPITVQQLTNWRNGELIQDAMPNLNDSQREFLLTGMTDDEWNKMCSGDDE